MTARVINIGKISTADAYRIVASLEERARTLHRAGDPTEAHVVMHIAQNIEAIIDDAKK